MNAKKSLLARIIAAFHSKDHIYDELQDAHLTISKLKEDLHVARSRGDHHLAEMQRLTKENADQAAELEKARANGSKLIAQRDKFRAQVREQNEADLFLQSVKMAKRALAGEKIPADDPELVLLRQKEAHYAQLNAYQQQCSALNAMQNANPYMTGLNALLGMGGLNPFNH